MSDLPPGWGETTLAEIAEVRLGRQRSPKNHSGSRMRQYVRAANLTWDGLDLSDVKEMNFTESESAIYELAPGDVLVAEASGSASEVGKAAIWRGEIEGCCFQNTVIRVRSYGASAEYLRYFLFSEARSGRVGNASPGVGIHHIGSRRLAEWPVPVPPLNEQRRIVAAIEEHLSSLDAADASLAAALRRLDALLTASFAAASNGGERRLVGELGEIVTGSTPATSNSAFWGDGLPFVTPSDLRHGRAISGAERSVTSLGAKCARPLPPRSVLVTCIGATIGKSSLALTACATNQQINAVIVDEDQVLPEFLLASLSGPAGQRLIKDASSSTTMPILNKSKFKALRVPLPPLEQQRRIVAKVEERLSVIDTTRASIGRAQRRSTALRAAILERAFRGELVPQDPADEPAEALLARIRAERDTSGPATGRRRRTVRP